MQPKPPTTVTLVQAMGPTEANVLGNVHGGIIMKICDEAGGIAAARYAHRPAVTVAVDSMSFVSPIRIGNLLTATAVVTWVGRTSIETLVKVTAEDVLTGEITHTNQAFFVYVALDEDGRPAPVPPLLCESAESQQLYEQAVERRRLRLRSA
jgi:acyl-CoA hydrolase